MATLPTALALTGLPADGGSIVANSIRNDLAAVQVDVNALLTILGAGANLQVLQSGGGTTVNWAGAFAAYTPTWTAAGVAPVLGNGTLSGRFVQFGKLVLYTMFFQAGSTSTFGTGVWNFTLPVTASASIPASTPIGVVYSLDASASAVNFSPLVFANTTQINIQGPLTWPTGTQNIYANTVPWTWATSDTLWATGIYEAA